MRNLKYYSLEQKGRVEKFRTLKKGIYLHIYLHCMYVYVCMYYLSVCVSVASGRRISFF